MNKIVINDLYDYDNRYIYQDEDNFKFSLDSILLAEFVERPKPKAKILDMCTGNAPVPLILSTKYNNSIVGYEIQNKIADLAVKSINYNNCNDQIQIINDDIKNIRNYFPGNNFDIITCNPPYFKCNKTSLTNDNLIKSIARHEIKITLKEIIEIAANNLNNKGTFYIVHRPERLDEIIHYAMLSGLCVKNIQFIITKENGEPTIVLLKMVKGGKAGVKVEKVINISSYISYKNIFD